MAWLGSSGGCAVYYFITSWLVGLSNYLVVCLVCMILVREKKTPFGTCKKKLLTHPGEEGSLSVGPPSRVQVPPALPRRHHRPPRHPGALHQVQVLVSFYFEPSTRSTVVSFGQGVCILSTRFDCQERKKDFRLQRKFSPGTPCTPCTSSSNCSYATSSLLSLSSSASSDQGATLFQIIPKKHNIFQDFCRQENLFDLPWRASSLRVWPLWSRTDQTS